MPHLTYLITAHGDSAHVVRLARTLARISPSSTIEVQYDSGHPIPHLENLAANGVRCVPSSEPIVWGDLSLTLELIAWIRSAKMQPDDWVVHLSGTDYPLPALGEFEAALRGGAYDMALTWSTPPVLIRRYFAQGRRASSRLGGSRVARLAIRATAKPLRGVAVRELPDGLWIERRSTPPFARDLPVVMGSDWFALSGRAAERLAAFAQDRSDVLRWFSRTYIPTEALTHTVLSHEPDLRNLALPLHYLEFEGAHPRWLTNAHLPKMLASGAPFARKFRDGEPVLGRLDALLF